MSPRILIISFTLLSLLASGCAAVLNTSHDSIEIHRKEPLGIIHENDTMSIATTSVKLTVERSAEDLTLIVFNDSTSRDIRIPARKSFAYWLNIPCNLGLGMLVDSDYPNKNSYPRQLHTDLQDGVKKYRPPNHKSGSADLEIFMPYMNNFVFRPDGYSGAKVNTGFLGLGLGLDIYHGTHQYFNIRLAGALDFLMPIPMPYYRDEGEYEDVHSAYLTLTHQHVLGRFRLGYGLSFSHNRWYYQNGENSSDPIVNRDQRWQAFGLDFPVKYMTGRHFYVGIDYRPSLYRFGSENAFAYEHLISFEMGWKILF